MDPLALWGSLTSDPTSGVALLSRSLVIEYANTRFARFFLGPQATSQSIIGQSVEDIYPEPMYKERIKISDQVAETGEPMLTRTMWQGQQVVTWIYPVAASPNHGPGEKVGQFLVVMRFYNEPADEIFEGDQKANLYYTEHIDLGELSKLTPRELVVMMLLAQGLTLKEVAKNAARSVKTIEAQRDSISRKLNLRNRGELVKRVHQIGLTLEDAHRHHISGEPSTSGKQGKHDNA